MSKIKNTNNQMNKDLVKKKYSIKSQLIVISLVMVSSVSLFIGYIGARSGRVSNNERATETLTNLASINADSINNKLSRIEQSVDILADEIMEQLDADLLKSSDEYVSEFSKRITTSVTSVGNYTEGTICGYVRLNPEFTEPTSGVFITRNNTDEEFESVTPTDFSVYDKSDLEHVGWYYTPVNNRASTWMEPYYNANVDKNMISYVIPLFDKDEENLGIVGLDIDYSEITEVIDKTVLYETGHVILVDSGLNVLYSNKEEKGADLSNVYNTSKLNTIQHTTIDNEDYQYVAEEVENGAFVILTVPSKEVTADGDALVLKIIFSNLIAMLVVGVFGILNLNHMFNPLYDLVGYINKLAKLDMTDKEIDSKVKVRKDEVGVIAGAIDNLHKEMADVISKIQEQGRILDTSNKEFIEKFGDITSSVANVNMAVEEIAEGSTSQATEAQKAGEAVIIMADAIASSTNSVNELEKSVESMNKVSDSLKTMLNELAEINEKTSNNITEVSEQTNETNESAKKIQEAVALIQEIASQTNLLSLNASIEAARAGEQGKGFAVVAEEIRKLSENSSASADQIDKVVKELIKNSNKAVSTMTEVYEDAQAEKGKLQESVKQFKGLGKEVEHVGSATKTILVQTQALEEVKNQVNEVVEQLAAISEENAASTEETSASMQVLSGTIEECKSETDTLAELSRNLKAETDKFKF